MYVRCSEELWMHVDFVKEVPTPPRRYRMRRHRIVPTTLRLQNRVRSETAPSVSRLTSSSQERSTNPVNTIHEKSCRADPHREYPVVFALRTCECTQP